MREDLFIEAEYDENLALKMQDIHSEIKEECFQVTKVADIDYREEFFEGKLNKRVVIYLMSNGCDWALGKGKGCTVCGHLGKQRRQDNPLSTNDYKNQIDGAIKEINFKDYSIVNIYNNGSFFNNNEIPEEAQDYILAKVSEIPEVKMVLVESRPEFINEERMIAISNIVKPQYMEIAMGLELKDDDLRKICINKGFSRKQFERAANIINKYFHLRTYVMLKPPFLTEKIAIEQAIDSIKYAFSIGSTTVSLEACTVQKYTLVDKLYDNNEYSPAWLWSIVKVIKETAGYGKLIVGLFRFYPNPHVVPHNCDKCNDMVFRAMKQYNQTLNINVFDGLDCECKQNWLKEVGNEISNKEKILLEASKIIESFSVY